MLAKYHSTYSNSSYIMIIIILFCFIFSLSSCTTTETYIVKEPKDFNDEDVEIVKIIPKEGQLINLYTNPGYFRKKVEEMNNVVIYRLPDTSVSKIKGNSVFKKNTILLKDIKEMNYKKDVFSSAKVFMWIGIAFASVILIGIISIIISPPKWGKFH